MKLFTIGYQGKPIDEFIKTLKDNNIDFLIDVRWRAGARRNKYFNKNLLKKTLDENNIKYSHRMNLGAAPSEREKLKRTGDYNLFFNNYKTGFCINSVNWLVDKLCENKSLVIMCMEADHSICHRTPLSEIVKEVVDNDFNVEIIHL